jgi:hypothetical protein
MGVVEAVPLTLLQVEQAVMDSVLVQVAVVVVVVQLWAVVVVMVAPDLSES